MLSVIAVSLCRGLQRRNHGWEGCLHLLGIMIVAEEYELAMDVYIACLQRSIWWLDTSGVTEVPM